MKKIFYAILPIFLFVGCNNNKFEYDASGIFESTEIIVSAQTTGILKVYNILEGNTLNAGDYIGYVDTVQLHLQKQQLQTMSMAVDSKRPDIALQIASIKNEINNAKINQQRIQNMFADKAATQKQLDDATTQVRVLESQLNAQLNTLSTSTNSIDKEAATYLIQVLQIEDQLEKSKLYSPINGTILNKYTQVGEFASPGKPLYKIANTKEMYLRAYVVYDQLAKIKINQITDVYITGEDGKQQILKGNVTWIADKAEFTPKTIQTVDERQNLVYATKILIDNSAGLVKIGMYGDVKFAQQ